MNWNVSVQIMYFGTLIIFKYTASLSTAIVLTRHNICTEQQGIFNNNNKLDVSYLLVLQSSRILNDICQ